MSWLEQKLKDWGVLALSPEEQKQKDVQAQAEKAEEEMKPVREEKQEKEKAQDDLRLVIDGAKLQCVMCTNPQGTLKVQLDTPSTQNKRTATVSEKNCMSLSFDGNCIKSPNSASPCKAVMQLQEWQDVGNGKIQGHEPLLLKSSIKCAYGGVPITITDCGQKHEPEEIDTTGAPVPIDEEPDPVKYVVTFERLPDYDGEFGFDWMRKAYLPVEEGGQGICVEGIDELKKLYEPFEIDIKDQEGKPYGNYYSPWVSLFPEHQKKIGKPVRLLMKVDFDFIENDIPFDEIVRFETSDPNLEIGVVKPVYVLATDSAKEILVPTVPLDDLYNGVVVQINCNGELAENATIDVMSSEGFSVGRLNVMKNIGFEQNILNLRIVYVKKAEVENDIQNIENELQKMGGFQALEDYLNKKVLCQSLLQCKVFKEDPEFGVLQLDFSNYSLTELGKVYKNGKLTDGALKYFQDRFKLKQDTHKASLRNGIFIFLTSMDSLDANGAAMSCPKDANGLIIYVNGISNNMSTYAHELGHVLGLLHSFLDKEEDTCDLISTENEIKEAKSKLSEYELKLDKNKSDLKENTDILKENESYRLKYGDTEDVLENIKQLENNIKGLKENSEKLKYSTKFWADRVEVLSENKIRFERVKTENIMDYTRNSDCSTPKNGTRNSSKRITFNKFQWDLMLKDMKHYL